jgi:hypothetical protein
MNTEENRHNTRSDNNWDEIIGIATTVVKGMEISL